MEQIELKTPAKIKVIFDGKEYSVSKPNFGKSRELARSLKEAAGDEDKIFGVIMKFLTDQGMSEEILNSLDDESLTLLLETLTPKKKT